MTPGILMTRRGDAPLHPRLQAEWDRLLGGGVTWGLAQTYAGEPCDLWTQARAEFERLFDGGCEVVCWLHDDMLPLPGWWEATLGALDSWGGPKGIVSPCNPEPLEGCDPFASDGECAVAWTPRDEWTPGAVAPLFIRRECWRECGGLDADLLCYAPWDLMRWAKRCGWDVLTYQGAAVLHAGRQSWLAGLAPLAVARAKNVYKLRHGIALDEDMFEWSEE